VKPRADLSALKSAIEGGGAARADSPDNDHGIQPPPDADDAATIALVDALAELAADLWFKGSLDAFPSDEERADAAE
jgi:hypothetical protein